MINIKNKRKKSNQKEIRNWNLWPRKTSTWMTKMPWSNSIKHRLLRTPSDSKALVSSGRDWRMEVEIWKAFNNYRTSRQLLLKLMWTKVYICETPCRFRQMKNPKIVKVALLKSIRDSLRKGDKAKVLRIITLKNWKLRNIKISWMNVKVNSRCSTEDFKTIRIILQTKVQS